MEQMNNKEKISIIIPVYNNEIFLKDCINSVLMQTYKNYEIIIINDGSEDDTLYVAKQFEEKFDCIKVIDIENRGQGYARNYGLNLAKGDYILFLDSDDFLEPIALEIAIERIIKDKSDLVVFDWKYYITNKNLYKYVNKDQFFNKKLLVGKECLELLSIKHFFTVNKLYSKKFLIKNEIRYGEGYIYEDHEFWVKVSINAKLVSLIHSPLYNVRISKTSTTKINYDTDFHSNSYIKAIDAVMKAIKGHEEEKYYYLYKYLIEKFFVYYNKRTSKEYKVQFITDFVEKMSSARLVNNNIPNKFIKLIFKWKIFEKNRINRFKLLYFLFNLKEKYNNAKKTIKSNLKKIIFKFRKEEIDLNIKQWKKNKDLRKKDIILFMGFDYRYTGNSRYLFEQIINERTEDVFFTTEDKQVDEKYRIKPNSEEFYNIFYSAKIVIFESWIPEKLKKTSDAVWIQLWHGTPLKKMLYDSNENEITSIKNNNKIKKFNDIKRWDYLLTDNENINKYFERAFLMPKKSILPLGYPRVEYLIKNKENYELKIEIKKKANLPLDKKIVSYLPTWRDYNYGIKEENLQLDYFLDKNRLEECLGDEYLIVSKNHSFLNSTNNELTNIDVETQELLLISDYIITDYSSVIFDAFTIDLPVVLLVKDYSRYMQSRGVYEELWKLMENMICETEEEASYKIKNYCIDASYNNIKEKLCYNNNRKCKLYKLILKMAERNGKLITNVLIFGEFNTIDNSIVEKLKRAEEIGTRLIIGVTNCKTKEDESFKKQKEILEELSKVDLVIPIENSKPTIDEIKKYKIDVIVTDSADNCEYACDVNYI